MYLSCICIYSLLRRSSNLKLSKRRAKWNTFSFKVDQSMRVFWAPLCMSGTARNYQRVRYQGIMGNSENVRIVARIGRRILKQQLLVYLRVLYDVSLAHPLPLLLTFRFSTPLPMMFYLKYLKCPKLILIELICNDQHRTHWLYIYMTAYN